MKYAPIALFVYKRLWHLQQTISSLLKNELAAESDIYIFSDGPKDNDTSYKIQEIRAWLENLSGFNRIHIITHEQNQGLAKSIIQGVTELVNQFGQVIVVEDDMIVSPYFLQYMNDGLNLYEQETNVASIHGYALPLKELMPKSYFLRGADCWGWATWKRAWDKFEVDGTKLLYLLEKQKLVHEFDFLGTQQYSKMLKDQIRGKNNSWAIRWHASAFLENMVTLYPRDSLVQNIGLDNSGEHCVTTSIMDTILSHEPVLLEKIAIVPNKQAFDAYVSYFSSIHVPFYKRVIQRAKKCFKRVYSQNDIIKNNV